MPTIQPLHRHADVRFVVFTRGSYRERSFERGALFTAGDFVIRPRFFAHDGFTQDGANYVRLGISPRAAARFVADHGWISRRGRIELADMPEMLRDPWAHNITLAAKAVSCLLSLALIRLIFRKYSSTSFLHRLSLSPCRGDITDHCGTGQRKRLIKTELGNEKDNLATRARGWV